MADPKVAREYLALDRARHEEAKARERYHRGGSVKDMVDAQHATDDAKTYAHRCTSGLHVREHQ